MGSMPFETAYGVAVAWMSGVLVSSLKGAALVLCAALVARALAPTTAAARHLVWALTITGLAMLPFLSQLVPAWEVAPRALNVLSAVAPVAGPPIGVPAAPPLAAGPPAPAATGRAFAPTAPPPPEPDPTTGSRSAVPAPPLAGALASEFDPSGLVATRQTPAVDPSPTLAGPGTSDLSSSRAVVRPRTASGHAVSRGVRGEAIVLSEHRAPLYAAILALVVWLTGAGLCVLPFVVARLRLRGIWRRAEPLSDPRDLRMLASTAFRLGLRRRVHARRSPETAVPLTWGTGRPVLLLPAGSTTWSRERLQHVLLHELAHVKRWDDATGALSHLACALHWFNPAVWWAAARLRTEREQACDDRVLDVGCRPSAYAQDLLDVARGLRSPSLLAAASVPMVRRSDLETRLTAILEPARARGAPSAAVVMMSFALLGTLVVPLAALGPRSDEARASEAVGVAPAVEAPVVLGQFRGTETAVPVGVGRPGISDPGAPDRSPARAGIAFAAPEPTIDGPGVAVGLRELPPPLRSVDSDARALLPATQVEPGFCSGGESRSRSFSSSDDDDRERHFEARWSSDDCSVEMRIEGRIEFTDAEDGIRWMAPGSTFELDVDDVDTERSIEAEPADDGAPVYDYRVDGQRRELDAGGRAWLAAIIPQVFRESGYQAEERVRRLLEEGGVDAVLDEVALMDSDYVERVYLSYLVEHGDLTTAQFERVVDVAGGDLDSDYELAELLIHVARTEGLSGPIRAPYLGAAESLDSDYEHRRVLSVLLDQPDLEQGLIDDVIRSATRIDSDYERAELLIQAGRIGTLSGPGRVSYLDALEGLGSDYETRRVLDTFLDHGSLSESELAEILAVSETIDSDYERAELLIRVGRENELSGEAATAYLRATADLDSDYEMRRTLKGVLGKADLGDEDVSMVLDLARDIDSDYERAELLIEIARSCTLDADLRARFVGAAEEIASEYERDRALAALVRFGEAR